MCVCVCVGVGVSLQSCGFRGGGRDLLHTSGAAPEPRPPRPFSPFLPRQVRPPMPPVYFFALDVSQAAVGSGLLAAAAAAIKGCLDK